MKRRSTLAPSHSERISLRKAHYANVDSVLKELKLLYRRLSTMMTAMADETQILNRLHYKNKNQHRSALFTRRVSELRRYSHRVEDFQICDLIDELRQTFFGPTEGFNSKQMKGSWSHFPDEKYVLHVREQLSLFSILLQKMHVISCKAFESFSLAMRSGAFIQLILTLVAITSRLATLVAEVIEIVQLVTSVIDRLLIVFKADMRESEFFPESAPTLDPLIGPTEVHPRQVPPPPRNERPSITIERKVVKRSDSHSGNTEERPRKKKKVKKDEIDDIFGF